MCNFWQRTMVISPKISRQYVNDYFSGNHLNIIYWFPPKLIRRWKKHVYNKLLSPIDVNALETPCPLYQHLLKKNLETDAYQMWRLKYKWLYDYLEEHSGLSLKKPLDMVDFHDTLKVEKLDGKAWVEHLYRFHFLLFKTWKLDCRIPNWAVRVYNEIEMLSIFEARSHTGTREMSRLKSGHLIREIFERFRNRTQGPLTPDRKIWMYSAHDTIISNVLNALNFPGVGFWIVLVVTFPYNSILLILEFLFRIYCHRIQPQSCSSCMN